MKSGFLFLFAVLFFSCAPTRASEPPKKPQVFALNAKTLHANKLRLQNKEAGLTEAYKNLLKEAEKALSQGPFSVVEKKQLPPSGDKHDYMSLAPYHWPDPTKPDGLPYIRKDGQTNPEVKDFQDKEYLPRMAELVYTLALAYYFSDEERFAAHAAKLVRVWFLDSATRMNPNLNYAQAIKGVNEGRGAGLIDTRHFVKLIDAIGLIGSSRHWKKEDQAGMKTWFASFLNWMQTSPVGLAEQKAQNNHGTYYDAQRLAMALFIDSTALARKIVEHTKERLDRQMDEEGKFPKEMQRTISLHYSTFNLNAFFTVATMAENLDIDFWKHITPSGHSLQKGFDFLYPYVAKKKEWMGEQIKPFDFEDAYPVLLKGSVKFKCRACRDEVMMLAGDKGPRLRVHLLY